MSKYNYPSTSAHTTTHAPVVWLTGMPGKTTMAKALYPKLRELGLKAEILDGDVVRKEISPELGFTKVDRDTCEASCILVQVVVEE